MIDHDNFDATIKRAYSFLRGQNGAPLPEGFFIEESPGSQKLPTGLFIDRANNLIFEATLVNDRISLVSSGLLFARSEAGVVMDRRLGVVLSAEAAHRELLALKAAGKESLPNLSILPVETYFRMREMNARNAPN